MTRSPHPSAAALGVVVAVLALSGCAPAAPSQSTGDPVGTWGTVAERSPHLVIETDGTMGGHDGCNGFGGAWEQPGPSAPAVFRDTVMSLVMCDGHDGWLTAVRSAVVDGDLLHVLDDEGTVLGTLPRTS